MHASRVRRLNCEIWEILRSMITACASPLTWQMDWKSINKNIFSHFSLISGNLVKTEGKFCRFKTAPSTETQPQNFSPLIHNNSYHLTILRWTPHANIWRNTCVRGKFIKNKGSEHITLCHDPHSRTHHEDFTTRRNVNTIFIIVGTRDVSSCTDVTYDTAHVKRLARKLTRLN